MTCHDIIKYRPFTLKETDDLILDPELYNSRNCQNTSFNWNAYKNCSLDSPLISFNSLDVRIPASAFGTGNYCLKLFNQDTEVTSVDMVIEPEDLIFAIDGGSKVTIKNGRHHFTASIFSGHPKNYFWACFGVNCPFQNNTLSEFSTDFESSATYEISLQITSIRGETKYSSQTLTADSSFLEIGLSCQSCESRGLHAIDVSRKTIISSRLAGVSLYDHEKFDFKWTSDTDILANAVLPDLIIEANTLKQMPSYSFTVQVFDGLEVATGKIEIPGIDQMNQGNCFIGKLDQSDSKIIRPFEDKIAFNCKNFVSKEGSQMSYQLVGKTTLGEVFTFFHGHQAHYETDILPLGYFDKAEYAFLLEKDVAFSIKICDTRSCQTVSNDDIFRVVGGNVDLDTHLALLTNKTDAHEKAIYLTALSSYLPYLESVEKYRYELVFLDIIAQFQPTDFILLDEVTAVDRISTLMNQVARFGHMKESLSAQALSLISEIEMAVQNNSNSIENLLKTTQSIYAQTDYQDFSSLERIFTTAMEYYSVYDKALEINSPNLTTIASKHAVPARKTFRLDSSPLSIQVTRSNDISELTTIVNQIPHENDRYPVFDVGTGYVFHHSNVTTLEIYDKLTKFDFDEVEFSLQTNRAAVDMDPISTEITILENEIATVPIEIILQQSEQFSYPLRLSAKLYSTKMINATVGSQTILIPEETEYFLDLGTSDKDIELTSNAQADIKLDLYYHGCQYFDVLSKHWRTNGVSSSLNTTHPENVICKTTHLTPFGAIVLRPPAALDIKKALKELDISKNPVALVMLLVYTTLFIFLLSIVRYLDFIELKWDHVMYICGDYNGLENKYEILIQTGNGFDAGTTANVGIKLYGDKALSDSKHLTKSLDNDNKRKYKKKLFESLTGTSINEPVSFKRGQTDVFSIATYEDIGEVEKIKLWHDNTGLEPSWFCSRVLIRNKQNGKKYYFLVDSWLHITPFDETSSVEIEVKSLKKEEVMKDTFENLVSKSKEFSWRDQHLWTAVFDKPTFSSYTRVQRIMVAFTSLMVFMTLTCIWYHSPNEDDAERNSYSEGF